MLRLTFASDTTFLKSKRDFSLLAVRKISRLFFFPLARDLLCEIRANNPENLLLSG
jgi:hypothetical protein